MEYLEWVGTTPSQSVAAAVAVDAMPTAKIVFEAEPPGSSHVVLFQKLFQESSAGSYKLSLPDFCAMLVRIGDSRNFGHAAEIVATAQQREAYFRSLKLADLMLARACAAGDESAWERFVELYHQPLTRAAIAISGSDTTGRELADALYAELYGLTSREGGRRSPLDSYQGRGSLLGWLRTTLAQRHVDQYRRSFRERPLDDEVPEPQSVEPEIAPIPEQLAILSQSVAGALDQRDAEEQFLLAAYFLDGRTLLQIAKVTGVHEATVSRKLHRLTDALRKQVLQNLQDAGLSKRAALEALSADPRDLDLNLKKLLQSSQLHPFPERTGR